MSERSRIVEGRWACSSCDTKEIPGRHKSCPNCNNPREEGAESRFDFGERSTSGGLRADSVCEDDLVEAARAGSDWLCAFCQTANPARGRRCRHCGAEQTERRLPARALDADAPPPAPPAPPAKKRRGMGLAIAAAGVLAIGGFFVWATRSTELAAKQVGPRWERVVHEEQFVRVTKEGWQDELRPRATVMPRHGRGEVPGVGNIHDCRRAQRGTRKVADGTERVCATKTRKVQCGTEERCAVKDLGNGFAEERCEDLPRYCDEPYEDCREQPRYRQEPVFAQKCRYDTWEWQRISTVRAEGTDWSPRWPAARVLSDGRQIREETYEVLYAYELDGEPQTYRQVATSEAQFSSLQSLRHAVIRVTNLGKVEALRPR